MADVPVADHKQAGASLKGKEKGGLVFEILYHFDCPLLRSHRLFFLFRLQLVMDTARFVSNIRYYVGNFVILLLVLTGQMDPQWLL